MNRSKKESDSSVKFSDTITADPQENSSNHNASNYQNSDEVFYQNQEASISTTNVPPRTGIHIHFKFIL